MHTLLEHLPNLPEQEWADAASSLLQGLTDNVRHELLSEAKTVLKAPALAHIFAPDTLAEVSVSGTVFGHRTRGIIDRLVVTPDRILAVDFKTNRTVPNDPTECPEGILRQLGCYVNMLEQIYPKRHIETAVLWTRRPVLMSMPHDLVTAALLRSPRLDVSRDGS